MFTRRNFIQALGLASVAGVAINLCGTALGQTSKSMDWFPIPAESISDPVLSFTSEHFLPFINTDFQIRQENSRRTETVRLLDVKEITRKANLAEGIQGDCFSLLFYSLRGTKLKSGQFEFTHFSLGTFNLTMMPVSAEPNRYEAVINHQRR
jgi:hypothetical protein